MGGVDNPEKEFISDIKRLYSYHRRRAFFCRDAVTVAKEILGDYLVLKDKKEYLIGKIVEVESYLGVEDDASHSYGGKITSRNYFLYEKGGIVYVYLIYGKFWCFNIVVSSKGNPQAVFLRALQPLSGIETMCRNRGIKEIKKLTNGPCRWSSAFGINKYYSGKPIFNKDLFIAYSPYKDFKIVKSKRIGIDYAQRSKNKLLRFYIYNNPFVSQV